MTNPEATGMPGPSSTWWEQYGPIGVVAFLALVAIFFGIRYALAERKAEQLRVAAREEAADKTIATLRASIDAQNAAMVQHVKEAHAATLKVLADQHAACEEKVEAVREEIDALHARHHEVTSANTKELHALAEAAVRALESLGRRST